MDNSLDWILKIVLLQKNYILCNTKIKLMETRGCLRTLRVYGQDWLEWLGPNNAQITHTLINRLEKYNVDPVTIEELMDKALSGMLSNLDAHSTFLNAKHFESMRIQTDGEFGGLGITV